MSPRVVFFGTPEFAVPMLEALCAASLTPELVVSQPARPVGRRRRVEQPPVARRALECGLAVDQPDRVGSSEFIERLRRLTPDVCAVVAFGQIFPPQLLTLPRLGCVNLHASLLPRHRGAAPIQAAIAAGDVTTGVTTMLMEEGLDSGPVLQTRELEIGRHETAGELSERLSRLGAGLLVETIEKLAAGELSPVVQDDGAATYARRLRRQDGRLDWTAAARSLERLVRAYTPWPGTFTEVKGEPVKILQAEIYSGDVEDDGPALGEFGALGSTRAPGQIVAVGQGKGKWKDALVVSCGDGDLLALERLQRAGKRGVSGRELASGLRLAIGDRLG